MGMCCNHNSVLFLFMKIILENLLPPIIISGRLQGVYEIKFDSGHFYFGSSVNIRSRASVWGRLLFAGGKAKGDFVDFMEKVKNCTKAKLEIKEVVINSGELLKVEDKYIKQNKGNPLLLNKNSSLGCKVWSQSVNGGDAFMYHSIGEAARAHNTKLRGIQMVLSGSRRSHKNYFFKVISDNGSIVEPPIIHKNNRKPFHQKVEKLSIKGEVVHVFKNKTLAAREAGVSLWSIKSCITGQLKTVKGFRYKFEENKFGNTVIR